MSLASVAHQGVNVMTLVDSLLETAIRSTNKLRTQTTQKPSASNQKTYFFDLTGFCPAIRRGWASVHHGRARWRLGPGTVLSRRAHARDHANHGAGLHQHSLPDMPWTTRRSRER